MTSPLLVYTPRPALRALLSRQGRRGCGPCSPSRPGSCAPPSRNAANTGECENDGAACKWGARTRGSRTTRQRARGPSREGEMRGTSVRERKGRGGFGDGQRWWRRAPAFAQRSEGGQLQPGWGLRGNGSARAPVPHLRTHRST